jgi:2-methylcitrate dehydratase PrpD
MGASIKKWPAGAPIQAALDALQTLVRAHGLDAEDVADLTVRLPDDRIHLVDDRDVPSLCAQHLLALLLQDMALGFAAAHDRARMRDPAVRAVRARIRLVADAALSEALPPRQAIVEITTQGGRRLRQHARAVRGTPDNPMDRPEVEAKALDLLEPVLGAERARALAEQIWRIERLSAVRTLRPLLQA